MQRGLRGVYAPIEPLPMIKELARTVKPGGKLTILAYSSEKLLPGYPSLEARFGSTNSGIAPFREGKEPEFHLMRSLGWFRKAGLANITVRTFTGDVHAPLSDKLRNALGGRGIGVE